MALTTAAAFGLISLLGGEISGPPARTIALAAAGGLSVFVMRVVLWWGAGVHVMGALAAELWCLWCFVVYLRTRHRRWLVGSWLALVAGLLVQERPVLTIGFLVLLRYVGLRRGPAVAGAGTELGATCPCGPGTPRSPPGTWRTACSSSRRNPDPGVLAMWSTSPSTASSTTSFPGRSVPASAGRSSRPG